MQIVHIALLFAAILIAGCSGEQHGDLQAYIKDVKAKQKSRIAPLPEVKPYEIFSYNAHDLRDPFQPYVDEASQQQAANTGITPDQNRKREALEQFPLDSLAFVGHLEKGGQQWALISAPDNTVYRVQAGNFVGKNYGEIMTITETTITLKEIIPNGLGGWIDREASLALSE